MQNILFVQTAFLGDLLLSVPVLKNCRRLYPAASISLVCRKGIGNLLKELGLVDSIYEIEKGKRQSYKIIQNQLRDVHFDLLLSPHESFRTMLFCWSVSATRKVSYKKWYQYVSYTDLVDRPMQYPEALRQIYLLSLISEDIKNKFQDLDKTVDWLQVTEKQIPDWATPNASSSLQPKENIVCMAPGSVWNTKMWPKEYFAKVATRCVAKGYDVYLIGAENEKPVCNWIASEVPAVKNMAGKTSLQNLYQLFSRSQLLVCNDSGPMHLASLLSLPTIAVFGPTVLSLGYRPWQNQAQVVEVSLPCRPCGKHGHQTCPIGTHDCMKLVDPDKISELAERMLI
jgi:heptosyltransferase-2